MSDDCSWYVVRTKPRNEYRAKRELLNQGYEPYLPEVRQRRLNRGREFVVSEPLFPRYLFVRISKTRGSWGSIRSTRGVTGMVVFGDSDPLPVSDDIVGAVRNTCRQCGIQPRFRQGDRVRIVPSHTGNAGTTEIWGELAFMDGEGRAVVLLSLLGRENKIEVATDRLTSR